MRGDTVDELLKNLSRWDPMMQLFTVLALAIIAGALVTVLTRSVLRAVCIILRGYPPLPIPLSDLPDCEHKDNLVQLCLKRPVCQTKTECDSYVASINHGKDGDAEQSKGVM